MVDNVSLRTDSLHLLCRYFCGVFPGAISKSRFLKKLLKCPYSFSKAPWLCFSMPTSFTARWMRRRWRMQRFHGWTSWRLCCRLGGCKDFMVGYYEDSVVDLDGDCDIEGSFWTELLNLDIYILRKYKRKYILWFLVRVSFNWCLW